MKFAPMVLVAASVLAISSAQAASSFSSPVVTADTATNLDVSWTWDLSKVANYYTFDTSAAPLLNWSAEVQGWKQSLRSSSVYVIDVVADKVPGAMSFEYEAGTFANGSSNPLFHDTALVNGRAYDLFISRDSANQSLWNVHLTGVAPVPEAETYAMLLAGLGLMGGIARRRKFH